MLSHILQSYQPYLPFIVVCTIALSLIAFLMVFMAGRRLMLRSNRRAALMPPAGIERVNNSSRKMSSFFRRGWEKLFNKPSAGATLGAASLPPFSSPAPTPGTLEASEEKTLRDNFRKVLKTLSTFFDGPEPAYAQPWYLLIGPEGSGKTTLTQELDLPLPIQNKDTSFNPQDMSPWYFEGGVVLDVKGTFILQRDSLNSEEEGWQALLKTLAKVRPQRPLDGIILTLSAEELVGPHRLTFDHIKDRAQVIYGKLWSMQRVLGMKIPVYVVINKTDLVPGFASFVAEIPAANRAEIFGWSCPYNLDTSFSKDWVHEIFNFLHYQLSKVRLGIFAHGKVEVERDGNMLFPAEFMTLKENLGNYLCHLFQESSYHDSFFLRGVYFTGQASLSTTSSVGFSLDVAKNTDDIVLSSLNVPLPRKTHVFNRDLFQKKIFRESHLAVPIPQIVNHRRKVVRTLKWAGTSLAGIWSLGIIYNYSTLREESEALIPTLKLVHHSLKGLHERGEGSSDPALLGYLNTQTSKILHAFVNLDNNNTWALFMPASWFSSLDKYIQTSFTAAYDRIILPGLYAALSHKGRELVNIKSEMGKKTFKTKNGFINPLFSSSFVQLSKYIQDLAAFEDFAKRYNNLDKSQSIEDLAALVTYLFHQEMPKQFFNDSDYYGIALSKALERNIDLSSYQIPASQKLGKLFKVFLDQTLNLQNSYPSFTLLQRSLLEFSDVARARHLDDKDVRKLLDAAIAVADIMSSGELAWLDSPNFNPGEAYESLLGVIVSLKLLGPDLAQALMRVADTEFKRFKLGLSEFKSPLTGPFFLVQDGNVVGEPTQGLVSLIDALSLFLDEPFMAPMDRYELTLKVPAGKALFWDEVPLVRASDLVDAYTHFASQKLTEISERLRPIFKVVARHTMRQKISSLVAQAQTFHDMPSLFDGFNIREVTHSQVANAANATPYFSKLLAAFQEDSYVENATPLREILVEQNYDILERIEKLLQLDNPYGAANEELISRWNGQEMLGLALFGVHSIAEMKNYLMAQRTRISFLAKDLAEPILTIISLGYEGAMHRSKGLPLVDKWVQIIKDLQSYDTQTVTNSVKILEDFLTYRLNELSIQDSCQFGDMDGEEFLGAADYFLAIRDKYYSMLKSRCELLAGYQSIQKFNQAALFFNQTLSHRYPFTPSPDVSEGLEADPNDVQAFFELYDSLNDNDRTLLEKSSETLAAPRAIADFIHQIDSIRPLLLASLDRGMKKHIPGIKVDISFRTDRHREIGGNKIIEWSMDFGDNLIDGRGSSSRGVWQAGSPIDVYLKWAADADTVPIPDPRRPELAISGTKATFSYGGRWSLIRLVRNHATPNSIFDDRLDAHPQTLEFFVPTAFSPACYQGKLPRLMDRKSAPARIYCQIALSMDEKSLNPWPAQKKGNGKRALFSSKMTHRLPVPRFPIEAPLVDALETRSLKSLKPRKLRNLS